MSKRIFSLVMTLLLVFSMVVPTMAAPLDDVKDTKYEEAVARLAALGILQGYEDGTFKADKTITRAEFAAVAMRSLGLDYTAKSSNGPTAFKDVDGSHWASGYINLATSRGIIKGFPDGTFKPEKEVTYAESITMLVRLLGYEPSVHGDNWPSNYLVKAAEIGVTGNLDFNQSAPAPRGDVAILTNNSLEIDLMERDTYGTGDEDYIEKSGETLLTEYLNVHEIEDAIISQTAGYSNGDLEANEVEVIYYDEDDDKQTKIFDLAEDFTVDNLLGYEVTLFVLDSDNDGIVENDEVITMAYNTTDEKDIISWDMPVGETFESDGAIGGSLDYDLDEDEITVHLDATDDTFAFASNAVVYFNHEDLDDDLYPIAKVVNEEWTETNAGYLEELYGTFILNDDDEIIFANLFNYDEPVVITEVDLEDEYVKYFKESDNESRIDLDLDDDVIYKNGQLATLEDLAEEDVLYFWETTNDKYVLEAYSGQITGTLEDIMSDGNVYYDYVFVIDGQTVYAGPNFTYSLDENDEITLLSTPIAEVSGDNMADLEDMVGQEVTMYLGRYQDATDGWNYGRHMTTSVEDNDSNYFLVTDPAWKALTSDWLYYVELVNSANDEVVYELTEDNTEFNGVELDLSTSVVETNDEDGKLVLYYNNDAAGVTNKLLPEDTLVDVDFNSDGTISAIEVVEAGDEDVIANVDVDRVDEDIEAIYFDSDWYNVKDDTAFFDVTTGEAITWADIEDIELNDVDLHVDYAVVDDTDLEAIAFSYTTGSVGTNDYAIVLKRSVKSDGLYVTLGVDGEVNEYYAGDLSPTHQNKLKEGTVARVDLSETEVDDVLDYPNNQAAVYSYKTTGEKDLTQNEFDNASFTVTGSDYSVVADTYGTIFRLDTDDDGYDTDNDTLLATYNSTTEKLNVVDVTVVDVDGDGDLDNSKFNVHFLEFEIVSGGVDTDDGTIEVVIAGLDEDEDPTYFLRVDQTGEDTVIYDVDSSWVSGQKVLSLDELADGDIIKAYDTNGDGIYDIIVVHDR